MSYEIVYTFQDYPSYTHFYDREGWSSMNKSFDMLSRIFLSEYLDDINPGNRLDWEQFMFYDCDDDSPVDNQSTIHELFENSVNKNKSI